MRTRRLICSLVMVFSLWTGEVLGSAPVAISPGSGSEVSIITQECPTFSWSGVEGAVSYNIALFEMHTSRVSTYEEMKETARPVISKEIGAPSLSWTPSLEHGLESGKRYVWYVGGMDSKGEGSWSEGKAFEVSLSLSTGTKEVVEGTVREYLTTEWIKSESYKEITKSLASEVAKGGGSVIGQEIPRKLPGFQGNWNTFYGTGAGYLTLGDDDFDTFIGAQAGYSNTAGSSNTFVGRSAGYANTYGNQNTFLGDSAGYSNTNDGNTFVGYFAGLANSEGYQNTFIGRTAGYANSTGDGNTFLGAYAGYFNTTGYLNTILGYFTGYYNTTGNWNTFLGVYAGYNNTGSGNVFLGFHAGSNEKGSNKLYIDNSNTSTPLIYGEFDNNKVVINGILSIVSSREYKENIDQLSTEEAMETLRNLKPVKFSYKVTPEERHAGFISEDVPDSLTTKERKAVSPMDIVAVLTKVVQEQQETVQKQQVVINILMEKLTQLEAKIEGPQTREIPLSILSQK